MPFHSTLLTIPTIILENAPLSVVFPIAAGMAVAFSIPKTRDIYQKIRQPRFRPPPAAFAPVWTVLYGLMGYAAHRAWVAGVHSPSPDTVALTKQGATLYTLQLGLNLAFTPLFFGLKRPVAAAVDIVALTGLVAYLSYTWSQVDAGAAYCLWPYIAWLLFASYIAIGCGHLNGWDFRRRLKEA